MSCATQWPAPVHRLFNVNNCSTITILSGGTDFKAKTIMALISPQGRYVPGQKKQLQLQE